MIPTALADHVEKNNLQGQMKFNLFVGASTGAETEDRWATLDMIDRRYPHQVGKNIKKGINTGRIRFADKHLSMFPQDLLYGYYTKDKADNKLDVVIVEATAITEDGWIVPGASVGATPELLQMADKIIIEVNTRIPSFEGLHDITMGTNPPNRKPYLIMNTEDRIGTVSLERNFSLSFLTFCPRNGISGVLTGCVSLFRLPFRSTKIKLLPLSKATALTTPAPTLLLMPHPKPSQVTWSNSWHTKSRWVVSLKTCFLCSPVSVTSPTLSLADSPSRPSKTSLCKLANNQIFDDHACPPPPPSSSYWSIDI